MSITLMYLINGNFMVFLFFFNMFMLIEFNSMTSWMMFMLFLMMKMIFFSIKEKMYLFSMYMKNFFLKMLFLFMILFFLCSHMIIFYLSFEIISLMIFFLIYFSSFSFMRLKASMYLILITGMGTFPMISMIYFMNEKTFMMIFLVSFLIKMPLLFFHLWLPKAHVEANYYDSMILASLLLKLGSYGLLILEFKFNSILFFGIFGGLLMSFLILKLIDMKMIMAFSSIIHMNLSLIFLLSSSFFVEKIYCLMMLSHAISSSIMFFMVGMIYEQTFSRNILINKSMYLNFYMFFLFMFFILFCNMGTPPFMTFFSEMYLYFMFLNYSFSYMLYIIVMIFFTSLFNIFLLKNISMMTKTKFFKLQNFKIQTNMLIFEHLFYLIYYI